MRLNCRNGKDGQAFAFAGLDGSLNNFSTRTLIGSANMTIVKEKMGGRE